MEVKVILTVLHIWITNAYNVISANICYFGLLNYLKLRMISRITELLLYKTLVLLVDLNSGLKGTRIYYCCSLDIAVESRGMQFI